MSRPGDHRARWAVLVLALLCLAAWLSTPWHLAVELHDHLLVAAHGHSHSHDDHDAPAPERHDPHEAGDHLLPTTTRSSPASVLVLDLAPRPTSTLAEPLGLVPQAVPPRDDAGPNTDPPPSARRPRAPPVG